MFDDVGDSAEPLVQIRRTHDAGEHHGQIPGFVILAGHCIAQGRCVDEVLQHHDIAGVFAQGVDQGAIGGLVGGAESLVVGQDDQEKIFGARFVESLGHLSCGDVRWCIARQDRERMLFGHLIERRERQG